MLRRLLLLTLTLSLTLLLCSAVAVAAPSPRTHVLHERRHGAPRGWVKRSRAHPQTRLRMQVAMKQSNLDDLERALMRVSDPSSAAYGQHWSHRAVAEAFAPSAATVDAVRGWLTAAGVGGERIGLSRSRGWVLFDATVEEAERLLEAEYHVYGHGESGRRHVACGEYHVPRHVQAHIDFVTPTVHFDVQVRERGVEGRAPGADGIGAWRGRHPTKMAHASEPVVDDLAHCSGNITPDCLRALYGIPVLPADAKVHPNNSFGVVQYTPQSYLGSDLDLFFSNYSQDQVHTRPVLRSVDGGDVFDLPDLADNVEADLDLQYAMALVNPLSVTLYQVGDLMETGSTSFNNFLDSIDAAYCVPQDLPGNTTTPGPAPDAIYPDPLPGGYKGPPNCGGYAASKVISTSYSYNEHDLTPAYEIRQCNEYAKLGLAGTTFVYCSSDHGVAGSLGQCLDPATGLANDGSTGSFAPSFPSTCPYVLSVGATQMRPDAAVTAPETACATQISSGGGFSNVFPLPGYQRRAVGGWFRAAGPVLGVGSDRFNSSGTARGYPDVSANGAGFVVALDGGYGYRLYGTSAAAPTVAAVIALVNEARMAVGKGSVGFVSVYPALFTYP